MPTVAGDPYLAMSGPAEFLFPPPEVMGKALSPITWDSYRR